MLKDCEVSSTSRTVARTKTLLAKEKPPTNHRSEMIDLTQRSVRSPWAFKRPSAVSKPRRSIKVWCISHLQSQMESRTGKFRWRRQAMFSRMADWSDGLIDELFLKTIGVREIIAKQGSLWGGSTCNEAMLQNFCNLNLVKHASDETMPVGEAENIFNMLICFTNISRNQIESISGSITVGLVLSTC